MKVCIVTIIDYNNYGNRLQNYALTRLLTSEGSEVLTGLEVIIKKNWERAEENIFKKIMKKLLPFRVFYNMQYKRINEEKNNRNNSDRSIKLKSFTEKYTTTLPFFIVKDDKHLRKLLDTYGFDYYIAGSDQVWNPYFAGKDHEFLNFASKNKRLSFAASFGVSKIPDNMKEKYRKYLKEMKFLSVREQEGVRIIKELTGREDAVWTIDPTLMFNKKEWEELLPERDKERETPYIVTYFLGSIPKAVQEFADLKGLRVIRLNDKEDQNYYSASVEDFLYYIHDADYVLTDSFHGTVFSMVFNKEFYVFKRMDEVENMFSRIEDILELTSLTSRIQDGDSIKEEKEISDKEWEKTAFLLMEKKKDALAELKKAMGST